MADNPELNPQALEQAAVIYKHLADKLTNKFVIAVSGETGSGKTTLAKALSRQFENAGIKTVILNFDDYFHYPPKTNEQKRRQDISWVGPQEVNRDLLQLHLLAFKNNIPSIIKPVVDYENNRFYEQSLIFRDKQVLLLEGTYIFDLKGIDYRIFLDLDYHETLERRKKRAREQLDEFLNRVLEIEHNIISKYKSQADLIIRYDKMEFIEKPQD